MTSYHFETLIPDNKTIYLPMDFDLINQEVEIFIIPKKIEKTSSVKDFLDTWAGAFKDVEPHSKYEYLMEKYK